MIEAIRRIQQASKRKHYPHSAQDWKQFSVELSNDQLLIGGWQVMQRWELPLMEVMADEVTAQGGDILEVGFGMGISADAIARRGCSSYTVIEAHPKIAQIARDWAEDKAFPAQVIEGLWQDVVPSLPEKYNGILFDTYPLSRKERSRNHFPFIPQAPRLLKQNGVLTFYSDETTRFRPEHLELLLANFSEVKLIKVAGLEPPTDCTYWHSDTMVVPVARKGKRDRVSVGSI